MQGMFSEPKNSIWRLATLAFLIWGVGMLMGTAFSGRNRTKTEDLILINSIKFRELLSLIQTDFIDPTDTDSLADAAMESLVEELDPHSMYIPKKNVYAGSVQLESNFEGIGAEFQFIEDTIWVSSVMKNSPSELGGLQAGDKIISVNKISVSGVNISNTEITNLVRGPKGTPAQIEVIRANSHKPVHLNLIRDKISSKSLDFIDLPQEGVGYIKCSRFTQSTGSEIKEALTTLIARGMRSLVLDLRDNSGGYVSAAIKVADEFLPENKLIVYTEGRNPEHNIKTYATSIGMFESGNLVVLINENTASAAEIVTGALQDHDRALVIGRRSFGKGLVQAPITLTDGSEVRLTISRYFTPSGRCIQKGFQRKKRQAYFKEFENRANNGELFNKDSIKTNGSPIFKTSFGRKVYGGGGIIPDLFTARDSIFLNEWVSRLVDKPVIYAFILKKFNSDREELSTMGFTKFVNEYTLDEPSYQELHHHLADFGNPISKKEFEKLKPQFSLYIKAGLSKCMWQYEGFYKVLNSKDPELKKALTFAPKSRKTLDNMVAARHKNPSKMN